MSAVSTLRAGGEIFITEEIFGGCVAISELCAKEANFGRESSKPGTISRQQQRSQRLPRFALSTPSPSTADCCRE